MTTTKWLILAALSLSVSTASAQVLPATDDTPTPEMQCTTLCSKVYASEPEKIAQCHEGCEQASKCTAGCSEKFPDDEEQRGRCNYRCARAR